MCSAAASRRAAALHLRLPHRLLYRRAPHRGRARRSHQRGSLDDHRALHGPSGAPLTLTLITRRSRPCRRPGRLRTASAWLFSDLRGHRAQPAMPPSSTCSGSPSAGRCTPSASSSAAAQLARQFRPSDISATFKANGTLHPGGEAYAQAAGEAFADLAPRIDGMVARPLSLSVAELRGLPARTQITRARLRRGWSASASGRAFRSACCSRRR